MQRSWPTQVQLHRRCDTPLPTRGISTRAVMARRSAFTMTAVRKSILQLHSKVETRLRTHIIKKKADSKRGGLAKIFSGQLICSRGDFGRLGKICGTWHRYMQQMRPHHRRHLLTTASWREMPQCVRARPICSQADQSRPSSSWVKNAFSHEDRKVTTVSWHPPGPRGYRPGAQKLLT